MKAITKYVAEDGSEHMSERDALRRDHVIGVVEIIMRPLGQIKDPGLSFANGGGYAQHDPAVVLAIRRHLCNEAKAVMPHKWFSETIEKGFDVDASWAGRLIDEIGGPLAEAWSRIMCIRPDGREYGQPFFAKHPDQAKTVEYPVSY